MNLVGQFPSSGSNIERFDDNHTRLYKQAYAEGVPVRFFLVQQNRSGDEEDVTFINYLTRLRELTQARNTIDILDELESFTHQISPLDISMGYYHTLISLNYPEANRLE